MYAAWGSRYSSRTISPALLQFSSIFKSVFPRI
jgi:hypothetical protein